MRLAGEPLAPHPQTLMSLLEDAARRAPERLFLVERTGTTQRTLTFAQAAERVPRIGAGLRSLGATGERPLLIVSGNGIDHALAALGAQSAGIPVVPVSARAGLAPAAADGFARLRAIASAVRPGIVFAADAAPYAGALRAVLPDVPVVAASAPQGVHAHDLARLATFAPPSEPPPIGPHTVAKILFTSGSTGDAKGVITTHGMICAMLQAISQAWPFLAERPPVMTDWLPWSHCFGGNKVFGIALRHAGTLYIDSGDPTPAGFARTLALRREVAPTLQFDVPLGWTAWLAQLRGDDALRRRWLAQLDLGSWGGATLAPSTRDGLRALGVPLGAGWGATETSPTIALTRGVDAPHDAVGVPVAGVEMRLIPAGDAYEARVRGPQVTPGYWWRHDLTAAAFDEEGYYRTGDLLRALDARRPERGLAFVSRLDDRFKLSSGRWLDAARVRAAFLAACPGAADALVDGEGRDAPVMLVWPSAHGAALDPALLRAQVADAMRRTEADGGRPRRALIVGEPLAGSERTEKGTLVRRTVQRTRAALLARLYASEPDAEVIVV